MSIYVLVESYSAKLIPDGAEADNKFDMHPTEDDRAFSDLGSSSNKCEIDNEDEDNGVGCR